MIFAVGKRFPFPSWQDNVGIHGHRALQYQPLPLIAPAALDDAPGRAPFSPGKAQIPAWQRPRGDAVPVCDGYFIFAGSQQVGNIIALYGEAFEIIPRAGSQNKSPTRRPLMFASYRP